MKIVLFSVLLALATSSARASQTECGMNTINQTVTIGGLFSVHTSKEGRCGPIKEPSFVNVQAMMYAVQQINADPDLLPNVTLTHDIRDTCGMSNQALEQTVGLMEIRRGGGGGGGGGEGGEQTDPLSISGVVGAALSDVSITVASLLRIFQVPQISHSSTAAVLSDKRQFDYFLRTIPPDSFQARAMASIIWHFGWSYVIGVHTDDTYGRGGIRSLAEELERSNETRVCMVMDEVTAIPLHADRTHYDRTLEFIRRSWINNASVVVLFVQRHNALELFDAIAAASRAAEASAGRDDYDHITWVASDSWATRLPRRHHERARGMLGIVPVSHHVQGFVDHFESLTLAQHSEEPWFAEFWQSNFRCSLDNTSNGQNACDADSQMLSYRNETGNGAEYVMDAVYAFAHAIQDVIASSCLNPSCLCEEVTVRRFNRRALNGTLLRDRLYNISFESPTSHKVKFDESGDQDGFYNIVNLGQSGVRNVGTWSNKNHLEITGEIEWRGGREGAGGVPQSVCSLPCGSGEERVGVLEQSDCCWTCEPCQASNMYSTGEECAACVEGTSPNQHRNACDTNPTIHLTWSDGWAVVIQLGAILGLAATAFVVVIFIVFNKHNIIKAACRELCAILLTGIALCYLLPFFFIAAPSPATCAIRRFSVGFCFSLCFAPLLMKTNRIYRVFHKAPRTPRFAGPKSQVVFTCLLVSVQAVMGAVWLIADQPGVKLIYHPNTTEKICNESLYVGLPIYLLYNLFILTLSTLYAFLARKIPAKFNETKFIGATLYSICVIWLAFIPTYFASIVKLGAVYITGTLVSAILLSATTTLVCLFIPKVIFVFADLKDGKKLKDTRRRSLSRGSISTDFTITPAEISSVTLDYKLSTDNSSTDADMRVCVANESNCAANNYTE